MYKMQGGQKGGRWRKVGVCKVEAWEQIHKLCGHSLLGLVSDLDAGACWKTPV